MADSPLVDGGSVSIFLVWQLTLVSNILAAHFFVFLLAAYSCLKSSFSPDLPHPHLYAGEACERGGWHALVQQHLQCDGAGGQGSEERGFEGEGGEKRRDEGQKWGNISSSASLPFFHIFDKHRYRFKQQYQLKSKL